MNFLQIILKFTDDFVNLNTKNHSFLENLSYLQMNL